MWQNVATCVHLKQNIAKCTGFVALLRKPRLSRPHLEAGDQLPADARLKVAHDAVGHHALAADRISHTVRPVSKDLEFESNSFLNVEGGFP